MKHTDTTQALLQALERKMGRDFIENLFEDFLHTEAYTSFAFFTDLLTGAYQNLRDTQWRMQVRATADLFLTDNDLA